MAGCGVLRAYAYLPLSIDRKMLCSQVSRSLVVRGPVPEASQSRLPGDTSATLHVGHPCSYFVHVLARPGCLRHVYIRGHLHPVHPRENL
eukprot:3189421-Pyramimonas_sp.AAC.1